MYRAAAIQQESKQASRDTNPSMYCDRSSGASVLINVKLLGRANALSAGAARASFVAHCLARGYVQGAGG
jgi:hypothetical protein